VPLSFHHPWMRPLCPPSREWVGAVPSPLIGEEQGVVMIPCWSVEQSLTLCRPFL